MKTESKAARDARNSHAAAKQSKGVYEFERISKVEVELALAACEGSEQHTVMFLRLVEKFLNEQESAPSLVKEFHRELMELRDRHVAKARNLKRGTDALLRKLAKR